MNLMLVYPAGFPDVADGGHINIIRGAHLYCDTTAESDTTAMGSEAQDENMANGWMKNKKHPVTGEPLQCERLDLPPGSLICCNTRAVSIAVLPLLLQSDQLCLAHDVECCWTLCRRSSPREPNG
jgi:hypothetical protein